MSNFKKGDRVLVRNKQHKWYGNVGILGEEISNMPGMYRVELGNGFAAGCYLTELEAL